MDFILPPLNEQYQIVKILNKLITLDEQIKENIATGDKIDEIKKTILAKAFLGELVTTDLCEPSSTGLLKEILFD